jgi:hypothetical protein
MMGIFENFVIPPEGVSKAIFYPQTPQGGLYKSLYFNSSAKRNLGVDIKKEAFETAPPGRGFGERK